MKGKAALLVGMAAGYVLGTRDGRERYEQIKGQANKVWNDPKVQEKAGQAQDLVKEKAPLVKDKASDAAHKASSKATSKLGKSKDASPEPADVIVVDTAAPIDPFEPVDPITPATPAFPAPGSPDA